MSYAEPDFHGTSRFEIRRHLGTGGMGAVYQAYDCDRKEDVALKTVLRADPTAVYLFKREFRNLADVAHPNLVNLYELLYEEGHWFFTMELLDGVDFLAYVRSGAAHSGRRRPEERPAAATTAVDLTGPADPVQAVAAPAVSPTQLERLRFSIRQLAEGLATLHDKGYLHRDLKPSNVMVTRAQRVVILDFGLSGELTPEDDNGVRAVHRHAHLHGARAGTSHQRDARQRLVRRRRDDLRGADGEGALRRELRRGPDSQEPDGCAATPASWWLACRRISTSCAQRCFVATRPRVRPCTRSSICCASRRTRR